MRNRTYAHKHTLHELLQQQFVYFCRAQWKQKKVVVAVRGGGGGGVVRSW